MHIVSPQGWPSVPCPTYPDIRLAAVTPGSMARRRGWPFTTAYHSRFPEYLQLRTGLPVNWSHALLRRFHNSGVATLVPTPHMGEELRRHGYRHPVHWSRGVNLEMFSPDGPVLTRPAGGSPVFLYVGRLAVEKNIDAFLRLALPGEKWVAGSAATGVPQAIDSISTRPKVSVSLGKTITSALR